MQQPTDASVWCRGCRAYRARAAFSAWALRRGDRECTRCQTRSSHRRRFGTLEGRLLTRLTVRARRAGTGPHPFTRTAIRALLDAFGRKSCVSGAAAGLTLAPIDPTQPITCANIMLVTEREALAFSHGRPVPPCAAEAAARACAALAA